MFGASAVLALFGYGFGLLCVVYALALVVPAWAAALIVGVDSLLVGAALFERLGDNLAELANKMREAANWRTYFSRNPWLATGGATAGGLLIAAILIPPGRNNRVCLRCSAKIEFALQPYQLWSRSGGRARSR